jgi:hypothetical protein
VKRFVSRLAILLVSLISLPAIGQISMRSGAPFVAVRTSQQTTGDLFTGTGLVARSSNGSTYVELTTNGNTIILIQDIRHKRSIEWIPKFHQYTIDPRPNLIALHCCRMIQKFREPLEVSRAKIHRRRRQRDYADWEAEDARA